MKSSKQLDYLAEIKKNHKVLTQFDQTEYDKLKGLTPDDEWSFARAMMYSNRLSSVPTIRPYVLALHCFYTGILFEIHAEKENIPITMEQLRFVYRHDIAEVVTGDVLLPVKIHSPGTKTRWETIEAEVLEKYPALDHYSDQFAEHSFPPLQFKLFKACDLLELFIFCMEERRMGNGQRGMNSVIKNCVNLLPEFGFDSVTDYVKAEGFAVAN